jgi:hypothetical protein
VWDACSRSRVNSKRTRSERCVWIREDPASDGKQPLQPHHPAEARVMRTKPSVLRRCDRVIGLTLVSNSYALSLQR